MWPFRQKGLMTPGQLLKKVERKGLEQKYFETIAEGRFRPEEIDVVLTEPGSTTKRTLATERFIEKEWQRRIAEGLKPLPNDLKPSRFRFVDAELINGRLQITLDPGVSYRDTIGSRPKEFEKQFGAESMPNPVAVTTVVRAKNQAGEGMILLTVRDKKHDIKPGGYHVSFGGAMEIKKDKSPNDTAVREVVEEAAIKEEELEEFVCRGVFKHIIGSSTEIIYEATARITVEEIRDRIRQKKHDEENSVIAIPTTASKLREWMVVPTHANVGMTNPAVLLVGKDIIRRDEGEVAANEWERMMLAFLAGRSEQAHRKGEAGLEARDVQRLENKIKAIQE
jgi:hypothetical protein